MNDLITLLGVLADSLEAREATASAGLIRQGARRLAELEALVGPQPPGTCDGCGTELPRARTGRPRRWCGRNGSCDAGKLRRTPRRPAQGPGGGEALNMAENAGERDDESAGLPPGAR